MFVALVANDVDAKQGEKVIQPPMHADAPGGAISRGHTLSFEVCRDR